MKAYGALFAAGLALASTAEPAEVYVLDPAISSAGSIPEVSREVVRLVVQDRLAGEASLDVSDSISLEDLTRSLGAYGKSEAVAWSDTSRSRTPQLVVMIEGVTQANSNKLRTTIKETRPAFTVPEPPSSEANQDLVSGDYAEFNRPCSFDLAIKQDDECWKGAHSLVVKYDVQKIPSILDDIAASFNNLQAWASSGELETTLILVPESSRYSPIGGWGPRAQSTLTRRQAETVMEFASTTPESASLSNGDLVNNLPAPEAKPLPYSFKTYKACMSNTFGCYGHGECQSPKGPNGEESHFTCVCGTTKDGTTGLETQWTGHSCERKDVSVEFWLFFGLFLVVVITIGGAMSAMYALGSEPIPSVLGAGVVKSK